MGTSRLNECFLKENQIRGCTLASWNVGCRHGWFGLQCWLYIWTWAMFKKIIIKNKLRFLTLKKKIQISGFSWKKSKGLSWLHTHSHPYQSSIQCWVKVTLFGGGMCSPDPNHLLKVSWTLRPWSDATLPSMTCLCRYLRFVDIGLDESTHWELSTFNWVI